MRKIKRIVRKTTSKKRAVWTRMLMKMGRRKTISEEREIMGLFQCDHVEDKHFVLYVFCLNIDTQP